MSKKTIFVSDLHLGVDTSLSSTERETLVCQWLMSIKEDVKTLYFVGDIFDYWFEYASVIPSGYSRFLSALRRLVDRGINIQFFTGNHDMWMFDYFKEEYGIPIYRQAQVVEIDGATFFIGHGDGLGPGDFLYKIIKRIFANYGCQRMFAMLHPTIAIGIMRRISQRDAKKYVRSDAFKGEAESLIQFARAYPDASIDYFVFGHRHLLYDFRLNPNQRIINLGDWISYFSFAVWDGQQLTLEQYGNPSKKAVCL